MSRVPPAADATASINDLASTLCRRLDARRHIDGPCAAPPHLTVGFFSVPAALTRLNLFLNLDKEYPAWIIDCARTLLRAIDRDFERAHLAKQLQHNHSDVDQAGKSTAWVSNNQPTQDFTLASLLRESLLQLAQAFELEVSEASALREQALDLRLAIEKSTDQIKRNEKIAEAVPPNRHHLRSVPWHQGPSDMEVEPVGSVKSEKTHSWRPTFRQRSTKSDDASLRSRRTPSIITTSSASSTRTTSTAASVMSGSSRTTLSTVSDYSDHKYDESDLQPRNEYSQDQPESEAMTPIARPSIASQHRHTDSTATVSDRPKLADTLAIRPRSEGKAQEVLGLRRTETAKPIPRPTAEIEMSSGKYQGYWRANFATSIPAAAAISASTILATAITTGGERALNVTPELNERAAVLRDNLDTAGSAQDAFAVLQTSDLATLVFTMRCSLDEGKCPEMLQKIALSMYQKIEEMGGLPHKAAKAWQGIAKLLKKIPEQTLVYLLFLVHIGRRLQSRKITINQKPAVVFLLEGFWPKVVSKSVYAAAGAVISIMLLDHFEDMPDELPVGLEAVRYQFKSGGRGDLLSLISQNRNIIEKGSRKDSKATTAS